MKALVALVSLDTAFLGRAKALLEDGGYVVIAFDEPACALQAFDGIMFDVLVATVVLGTSNGFELGEQARARSPRVQVVLASRTAHQSKGVDASFDNLLDYEFTADAFERRIRPTVAADRRTHDTLGEIRRYLDQRMNN